MKKLVSAGLIAFCLIAVAHQHASAWTNSKFGVGLNWERQAGGNSSFWGLWRNGQPPGPEAFGGGYGCPQGGHRALPMQPFAPPAGFVPNGVAPAPQPLVPMSFPAPSFGAQGNMNPYLNNPYQTMNHPRPVYYYSMPYYGR